LLQLPWARRPTRAATTVKSSSWRKEAPGRKSCRRKPTYNRRAIRVAGSLDSALLSHVLGQRPSLRLRQEGRGEKSEDIDAGENHRRLAVAAELHDQRAGEQRAEKGDETRRIEDEGDAGAARAGGKQFRLPHRHPRILHQGEERLDCGRKQQELEVLRPQIEERGHEERHGEIEIGRASCREREYVDGHDVTS